LPPRRTTLRKSLVAIERAFADIESLFAALAERVRAAEREVGRSVETKGKPRRQLKITAKRHAQLKLQGAYMGYMNKLAPRQKARVRAVKEKRGFEAAIRVARKIAGR